MDLNSLKTEINFLSRFSLFYVSGFALFLSIHVYLYQENIFAKKKENIKSGSDKNSCIFENFTPKYHFIKNFTVEYTHQIYSLCNVTLNVPI